MKVKIKNKALANVLNYNIDDVIELECRGGIPVNREWRNRLKDSAIDGCIEIVKEKKGDKS